MGCILTHPQDESFEILPVTTDPKGGNHRSGFSINKETKAQYEAHLKLYQPTFEIFKNKSSQEQIDELKSKEGGFDDPSNINCKDILENVYDDRKVEQLSKKEREKLFKMFTFAKEEQQHVRQTIKREVKRDTIRRSYGVRSLGSVNSLQNNEYSSPVPELTEEEQLLYNNKQLILNACKEIKNYVEPDSNDDSDEYLR